MTSILTIGSSSSGNCYVVETAYNGGLRSRLIIEAGVRFKALQAALKFDLSDIDGVLVSHEHGDHAGFVKQYAERGYVIYTTKGTLDAINLPIGGTGVFIEKKRIYIIGKFKVMAFTTEHDAADPCGFIIDCPDGNRICFATDTYYLRYLFPKITIYMLECNYEEKLLQRNIKNGIVHPSVGERVRHSHMSVQQCIGTLTSNDLSKVKLILLIHLSKDNSNAEMFKSQVEEATGKLVYVAKKDLRVQVF